MLINELQLERKARQTLPAKESAYEKAMSERIEVNAVTPSIFNEIAHNRIQPGVNGPHAQRDAVLEGVRCAPGEGKIETLGLNFYYGQTQALKDISLKIQANKVTALIGPSGCGKSTFLRSLNRMNDLIKGTRVLGQVLIDGADIYQPGLDITQLRRRVGMVFQKSNPFPKTIFDNVAYGMRINGFDCSHSELAERVEESLKGAALWPEVKDILNRNAFDLSGGQQQRLCIARALAIKPEIILMDEPASALDPLSTAKVEELIHQLAQKYTVVIVTHNMQQAARVSDYTAFFYLGELIEFDDTQKMFTNPTNKRTEDYITGRFG